MDALPDPVSVLARALHSSPVVSALWPSMDAAQVMALAHHLCASLEAGGFPLTCLANGDVALASPGYDAPRLGYDAEELCAMNLNNLASILRTLSEECSWMQAVIADQAKLIEVFRAATA